MDQVIRNSGGPRAESRKGRFAATYLALCSKLSALGPPLSARQSQGSGRRLRLLALCSGGLVGVIAVAGLLLAYAPPTASGPLRGSARPAFDGERSYQYLVQICRIGRRMSGSQGMARQQRMIADHFSELEAHVQFQPFDVVHPLSGVPVRMHNIIVSWHPQAKRRVLLACHYDTRPFPDRDPINPRGRFIGANDGASGVALLMELGNHLKDLKPTYGVDFVFFDGEELVYGERGEYFLGSTYFAKTYRSDPPEYEYVYGVLVDMIGDRHLAVYKEQNSVKFAPALTDSLWDTARDLHVPEFIDRPKHEIRDDHLPLNQIAGIPTCDIIDFDYPHWHTASDVPANCSGKSLAQVGRVLLHWLEHVPPPPARGKERR